MAHLLNIQPLARPQEDVASAWSLSKILYGGISLIPPGTESASFTYYIHHRNWELLKQSVDNGCELCKLLYNGYLHTRHERRSAKHESDSVDDTEFKLSKSLSAEAPGTFVFYVPYDYYELSGPLRIFFCHTDMFEESTLEAVSRHDSSAMAEFAIAANPGESW